MTNPIPLAMVVCDGFYKDEFSGKHTLIGTFSHLRGARFPIVHPHITTYVSLTNGHGHGELLLEMVDVDEEHKVFEFRGPLDFADPRDVVEICLQAGRLEFHKAGEYRLRLLVNGEFLMERRIFVMQPTG